jgi:exonuclease III
MHFFIISPLSFCAENNLDHYPWRRGPRLGPITEDRDIICLLERHEHEGCKTPLFEGYVKMTVWNRAAENGKGQGGIMILVRKKEGRLIQFEGEDSNKQFTWFKILENGNTVTIATCYVSPQV